MIELTEGPDGTIVEPLWFGVAWVRDTRTDRDPECGPGDFECCECGEGIAEDAMMTCLDGGDAAHMSCVQITKPEPEP